MDSEAATTAPTCETSGYTTYTAAFENDLFEAQTKTIPGADALGHSYGTATYVWSTDNSTCTATVACQHSGCISVITETVDSTSLIKTPAKCGVAGTHTYTATFTNTEYFAEQSKDVDDIPALTHSYGTPVYTWSSDNSTCTATATCTNGDCGDVVTETVDSVAATTAPTCEAAGYTTYIATFSNSMFEAQTKTIPGADAIGHSYGTATYAWSTDYSTCTATVTCQHSGCNSAITETVNSTNVIKTPAKCETVGTHTYTAAFTNTDYFATQTRDEDDILALGHSFGTPSYIWSDDNKTCTATASCTRNGCTEIASETVNSVSVVTAPTCETAGSVTFTASFTNSLFASQSKTVDGESALGHSYGTPVYTWTNDGKSCTATVTCTRTGCTDTITETVNTVGTVKTPATDDTVGTTTYTATFTNSLFTAQTKDIDNIPALGHKYGTPVYTWTEDGKMCTATVSCTTEGCTSNITETVDATGSVKAAATCEAKGTTTYTATFANSLFATQTKDVEDIAVLGHSFGIPEYNWSEDGKKCTATVKCANEGCTETITETVDAVGTVKSAAACEKKGTTTYTATFTNSKFTTQTKDVEDIAALVHTYGTPEYTWSDDGKNCIATVKCTNEGCTDAISETAEISSKVKIDATTYSKGVTTYTATFKNNLFATQTKDVEDIAVIPTQAPVNNTSDNTSGGSSSGSSAGSGSSGGSNGSGNNGGSTVVVPTDNSTTKTETKTNADGSKTTTETTIQKDGTVTTTETTVKTNADGSVIETETKTETKTNADGSVTETETKTETKTDADGTVTETETKTNADGSGTETETKKEKDGTITSTTKATDADGKVVQEVTETVEKSTVSTTVTTKTVTVESTVETTETTYLNGKKETTSIENTAAGTIIETKTVEAAGKNGKVESTETTKDADENVIQVVTTVKETDMLSTTVTTQTVTEESIVETTETTFANGSKETVTTQTNADGTVTETVESVDRKGNTEKQTFEVAADGTVTASLESTKKDGSSESTIIEISAETGVNITDKAVGKKGKATTATYSADVEAVAEALANNEAIPVALDKIKSNAKKVVIETSFEAQGQKAQVATLSRGSITGNKVESVEFKAGVNSVNEIKAGAITKSTKKLNTIRIVVGNKKDANALTIDKKAFAKLRNCNIVIVTKSDKAYDIVKEKLEASGLDSSVSISRSKK